MGWASGSELFEKVYEINRPFLKDKPELIKELIEAFEDCDCDTIYEVVEDYPELSKVFKEMHPEDEDDE